MSEEIRQDLGFDASKALDTLKALDKSMGSFEQRLGQSVQAMAEFNKRGGKTVATLKKLSSEGNKAAAALAKVASLSGQAPGGKSGASVAPVAGVDQYIKQLESMYKVSGKATDAQKRSFQSTITATAEYAAKNKISMGQVIAQSNNLDKNFTGTANSMANQLSKLDRASKAHLNSVGKSVQKLTIDFHTMARIVTTQVIVRALSSIRNVFRGAVSGAVEFQTSIAEIGTIAPTDDLGLLADRVRSISDAFNTPLETTAKGYYQTISNQIGDATDEFDTFVESAAKFSKITSADLDSAVNLGSGTLNAFGKTAAESEDTFAKFFTTIKQGRVVGAELAQGYGTVAPLADKLGVEFEEVNAALATITIQGVAADKAFTQLRGVFNSFLKPTPEMTKALRELGFASGEEILRAYDLQTALRKVAGTTDGSAESLAKLIPRVRGLTGGISLVDDEAEHFNETMRAQAKGLQEVYDKNYELVIGTDAFKVTKEINQLSNYLTTEFGESVLESAGKMLVWTGGAEQMQRVLSAIGPTLPIMAVGITTIGTALAAMALRAKLASVGLKGMVGPLGFLAAAPVAWALGDYIGQSIVDSWNAEQRAFDKLMDKELEARQKKVSEEVALEKAKAKELVALLAQGGAEARKKYFAIADDAIDSNKSILADLKHFTSGVIREASRASQAAKSRIENLGKNILSSEQRVGKLRTQLDDKIFSNRIKKQNELRKVFALTGRAGEIATRAEANLRKAATQGQRTSAGEEFSRAKAFAEQALSIAEGADNASLERRALASLEAITKKNIAAEGTYQKTLAGSRVELARRAKTEEKRVTDLKNKQKSLLDAYTLYDKKTGELLSGDERAKKLAGAQKQLREFIELASKDRPIDVSSVLSYANLSAQLAREMDSFRVNEILASDAALNKLHDQVKGTLNQIYIDSPSARVLTSATGIELTGPASQRKAEERLNSELNNLIETQGRYKTANDDVALASKTLQQRLSQVQSSASGLDATFAAMFSHVDSLFGFTDDPEMFQGMRDALQLVRQAAEGGSVSLDELKKTAESLKTLESEQSWVSGTLTGDFKTDVNAAILALGKLIQAREALNQVQSKAPGQLPYEEVLNRIRELQSYRSVLEKPSQDARMMNTALGTAKAAMEGSTSPAAQLASHWQSIAMSAQTAAAASQRIGIQTGTAYHASGGLARGTDTIPAMLSPGEFVVNARSSRQFYSQLSAMNAGMQPVYRESGGSVTTIGDVSISVTESNSPKQTARDVMSAFRREMRRGSARL